MNIGDLTTLENVKGWLGASGSDDLLRRLITSQSRFMQQWLNRQIAPKVYNEVRDGMGFGAGRYTMMFDNYPVSSMLSLTINGTPVGASSDGAILAAGYGFDANEIWLAPSTPILNGFGTAVFSKGKRNVRMSYIAGFLVMPMLSVPDDNVGLLPAEQQTIPNTPNAYDLKTFFTWTSDNGVSYANGTPFVKVTGTPVQGQYSVTSTGTYKFNAADAGQDVLLSYGYVPPDIEQSCVELVGLRFKERDRIGINSKTVGTEMISYSTKDMPNDVATILSQYKKVFNF